MKYSIHVTQAAERDMANAYDYIDLVLKNPTAADKLLDVADEKIGALAEFPHKFEVVSDKLLSLWGIRFTIVMNYLAFYTVDDAFPFGHGEKSVYLIERFMRLKPVEAMAIRWHMGGFDDAAKGGSFAISLAFDRYPLAVKLHMADLESTYLREKGTSDVC